MKSRRLATLAQAAIVAALVFFPSLRAGAEEFSFYGVRFGMTQEEVGTQWLLLSDGKYAVPSSSIHQVVARFDYEGKLYAVSFSLELSVDGPRALVSSALQDLVESKWGRGEPDLETSLVIGPRGNTLTVEHRKMREAYINYLKGKITPLFQP
jgi:hypothetical protein